MKMNESWGDAHTSIKRQRRANRARRWRSMLVCGCVFFVLFTIESRRGAGADIQPKDLRRGLIANFRSADTGKSASYSSLEPTIALRLGAGESRHPRLSANGLTASWNGFLVIYRPGDYRFQIRLRGNFALKIA